MKMKFSVIIVAGAQACGNRGHVERTCGNRVCDFEEWLENNWWESAVESFIFVSKNWEEFANVVKSVSRTDHFFERKIIKYIF